MIDTAGLFLVSGSHKSVGSSKLLGLSRVSRCCTAGGELQNVAGLLFSISIYSSESERLSNCELEV